MKRSIKLTIGICAWSVIGAAGLSLLFQGCTSGNEDTSRTVEEVSDKGMLTNDNLVAVKEKDGLISIKNIVTGETTIKNIKVDWMQSSRDFKYLLLFQLLGVYLGVEFQTHPIMNIKRNIIFSLESRKKNGAPIVENVPIRMRVVFASHRIEFTTGYRIDAAKWDADKQRVKNGCTNKLKQSASEINADLLKY